MIPLPLPKNSIRFGGLEIEFNFPDQADGEAALKTAYASNYMPSNFFTSLARQSSNEDFGFRQAVLDVMMPFSVASNLWAANALANLDSEFEVNKVVYLKSHFGVQYAFDLKANPRLFELEKVFVEECPVALTVSEISHCDNFSFNNLEFVNCSVKGFDLSKLEDNTVVVCTNLESIDPGLFQNLVIEAPDTTRWVLQGLGNFPLGYNGKSVASPISSLDDITKYFNAEPLLLGEMRTSLGTRFMAVM